MKPEQPKKTSGPAATPATVAPPVAVNGPETLPAAYDGLSRGVFIDLAFLLVWQHSRSVNMAASDAHKLWDQWQARKAVGK